MSYRESAVRIRPVDIEINESKCAPTAKPYIGVRLQMPRLLASPGTALLPISNIAVQDGLGYPRSHPIRIGTIASEGSSFETWRSIRS